MAKGLGGYCRIRGDGRAGAADVAQPPQAPAALTGQQQDQRATTTAVPGMPLAAVLAALAGTQVIGEGFAACMVAQVSHHRSADATGPHGNRAAAVTQQCPPEGERADLHRPGAPPRARGRAGPHRSFLRAVTGVAGSAHRPVCEAREGWRRHTVVQMSAPGVCLTPDENRAEAH